jgi:hypothetical protein
MMIRTSDKLAIDEYLRTLPDLCGLVLYGVFENFWPSYAIIGRDLPIAVAASPADYAATQAAGNYILVRRNGAPDDPRLAVAVPEKCWRNFCLLRRPGTCSPAPQYAPNLILERESE